MLYGLSYYLHKGEIKLVFILEGRSSNTIWNSCKITVTVIVINNNFALFNFFLIKLDCVRYGDLIKLM